MKNDPAQSTSTNVTQFQLLTLFYVIAVWAIGLIVWHWTIVLTPGVLIFWWLIANRERIQTSVGQAIAGMCAGLFLLLLALPAIQVTRGPHPHTYCLNNVRQCMLAIINWESNKKGFPPAYTKDDNGNPNLSWRVLILPDIDQDALYAKFNLTEPWDSDHNIKLLEQMPALYSCDLHRKLDTHTPYKLVVDKGTLFEGGQIRQFEDLKDGSSNTIGIVEDVQNPVPWTKPEDLSIEEAIELLAPEDPRAVAHVFHAGKFQTSYGGASVGLMDGSTHFFGPKIDKEVLRRWFLIDDGATMEDSDKGSPYVTVNWSYFVAIALYVFLLVLPGLVLFYKR